MVVKNCRLFNSEKESEDYQSISTSWELAFRDFEVAVGSNLLENSTIAEGIEKEEVDFAEEVAAQVQGNG